MADACRTYVPVPVLLQSMFGDTYKNFQAGLIAGTIATTLNNPFDVVKSRIQNVLPGQPRRYNWVWPGIFKIAREEGWKALYKGYLPKVLRLGPGGGIMLVGFEFFAPHIYRIFYK
jgi:solute carrier family 25 2-oxodicarboxylate transporter 21